MAVQVEQPPPRLEASRDGAGLGPGQLVGAAQGGQLLAAAPHRRRLRSPVQADQAPTSVGKTPRRLRRLQPSRARNSSTAPASPDRKRRDPPIQTSARRRQADRWRPRWAGSPGHRPTAGWRLGDHRRRLGHLPRRAAWRSTRAFGLARGTSSPTGPPHPAVGDEAGTGSRRRPPTAWTPPPSGDSGQRHPLAVQPTMSATTCSVSFDGRRGPSFWGARPSMPSALQASRHFRNVRS